MGHPENPVIVSWTDTIHDPDSRRRAFELFSVHPFMNSGFAAGTARALLGYLREGDRLLNSSALFGVGPWGDQAALNLYCHSDPIRWREVPDAWNYSLAARDLRAYVYRSRRLDRGCQRGPSLRRSWQCGDARDGVHPLPDDMISGRTASPRSTRDSRSSPG